mmetsp:Transcript_86872/g.153630  ORF Transcript_86872/g.153630 Transcript_86872/m.153630 type:complete len:248 (+) Transcript_86872:51-794(+)|eukprot:CAMPEP_0197651642 /NCGR_PEP_ID=MMETSP1338-20131121/33438_1 /TAXON_ID=43686 ORGANISM="Pelagodinium beii, Strain RCC1491" /NCGR_SAMPLE_ID=MMETSP1338 /ASSEMBLY_ACC=CAM_ASM_000754 /LENGTH=247 /DNA_ID=CAMNT_0043226333 /DNA_START=51 /DNA_END=794 /DNA_ORIENTATION=-
MVLLVALGSAAVGVAGGMTIAKKQSQTQLNNPKLVYFDAKGVVEHVRYLFHMSGTPYVDHRYPFSFGVPGDFSTIKRPEFDAAKAAGELDVSMGKVPLLEVDGVKVGQSKAIERFVAKQVGYMGSNAMEEFQIDAMCEHIRDLKDAYQKLRAIKDDTEKKEAMEKWFSQELPEHAGKLEKAVPSFLTTCGVTLADITVYYFFTFFFDRVEDAQKAKAGCPKLNTMCAKVKNDAKAKEWEEKRPKTMF